MSQEVEIEFKNLLTKTEFNTLKKAFSLTNQSFFSQINYYFDTKSFSLAGQKSALRVRKKNNNYELTLKQPHPDGLLETNQQISKEQFQTLKDGVFPDGEVKSILLLLNISPNTLIFLGDLTTNRAETRYKEGLLVLDHSFYLGKEDYELEYEVKNAAVGKDDFNRLLHIHHIPMRKTNNKIKRFFDEKKRQKTFHSNE
ncbi:CYTH domain-containing protein [Bacillus taeanensis]|uniref:CYTH domain-containing protein n=1 Tax=Bacillus taeanensis TaxID=273032 RepID=A0A366XVL8_9BACI|nr:CYTH domain-containing protein [Bacillus taeanensis]RBW69947.1 hypothetical protein DS031_08815 [Bacillus taeanensis]